MFLPSVVAFTWSAVHAVLAAVLVFGGSAFWVFYRTHKRLTALEERGGKRKAAIFGSDNNPLNVGLTKEVSALKKEVDELREDIEESNEGRSEMETRLAEIEVKVDRLLDKLDDGDDEP